MPRILVIDDDEQTTAMFEEIMTRAGYAVVTAPNGAAGLKEFRSAPADVVLTDLLMPDMDGLETVRELCKVSPGVKIIAMSGGGRYGDFTNLDVARGLGAALVFEKPISVPQLLAAIKGLLAD